MLLPALVQSQRQDNFDLLYASVQFLIQPRWTATVTLWSAFCASALNESDPRLEALQSFTTTGRHPIHTTHSLSLFRLQIYICCGCIGVWAWPVQQGLSRTVSWVPRLYISGALVLILKNVKFHALYDFFIASPSSYTLQCECVCVDCVWEPVIQCLMKSASVPPLPFLSFAGCLAPELWSRISAGSLVTTDGEETLTIGGRGGVCVGGCSWCKVQRPPYPTGWCQVKTMAKWPRRSYTLTGVNIDTLKAPEAGEKEDLL